MLISNERNYIGTGFLSKHAHTDNWDKEHKSIMKERKRIWGNKHG